MRTFVVVVLLIGALLATAIGVLALAVHGGTFSPDEGGLGCRLKIGLAIPWIVALGLVGGRSPSRHADGDPAAVRLRTDCLLDGPRNPHAIMRTRTFRLRAASATGHVTRCHISVYRCQHGLRRERRSRSHPRSVRRTMVSPSTTSSSSCSGTTGPRSSWGARWVSQRIACARVARAVRAMLFGSL